MISSETDQNSGFYFLLPCTWNNYLLWCKRYYFPVVVTPWHRFKWPHWDWGIFASFHHGFFPLFHRVSHLLYYNEITHIYTIYMITSIVITKPNYVKTIKKMKFYCMKVLCIIVKKGNNSCINCINSQITGKRRFSLQSIFKLSIY